MIKKKTKEYKAIENSEFFDSAYYASHRKSLASKDVDLVEHYLKSGWIDGLNPSKDFIGDDYLTLNPDVKEQNINPLAHYEMFGKNEKRKYKIIQKKMRRKKVEKPKLDTRFVDVARVQAAMFKIEEEAKGSVKFILLFSHMLNLTGAPRALFNMAMVLKEQGYYPVILSLRGGDMSKELEENNIPYLVVADFKDPTTCQIISEFMNLFDVTIFNTLVTVKLVNKLMDNDTYKIAWIHEGSFEYDNATADTDIGKCLNCFDKVYSVGSYSKSFTDKYISEEKSSSLLYGMDDTASDDDYSTSHDKVVFSVTGSISERKAQSVMLDAIELMPKDALDKSEFVFMGPSLDVETTVRLFRMEREYSNIKYLGSLPYDEILDMMHNIDVVVTPSLDDPMPIVATEAMMFKKVSIVSKNTGTASFIKDGINGYVVEAGDAKGLCDALVRAINEREKFASMGEEGRKVYENNFTTDCFTKNIQDIIDEYEKCIELKRNKEKEEDSVQTLEAKLFDIECGETETRFAIGIPCENNISITIGGMAVNHQDVYDREDYKCFNEFLGDSQQKLCIFKTDICKDELFNKEIVVTTNDEVQVKLIISNYVNMYVLSKKGYYVQVLDDDKIKICRRDEFIEYAKLKAGERGATREILDELLMEPEKEYSLYMETLNNHNDNAYSLFLEDLKTNDKAYFVTSKQVYDNETNIHYKDHYVVLNTEQYKSMVPRAKKIVASWWMFPVYGYERSEILYPFLNYEFTSVLHGVSYDKNSYYLHYFNFGRAKETICCSEFEKEYLETCVGLNNVKVMGYPRMDKWADKKLDEKMIVLFPTWRKEVSDTYVNDICRICLYIKDKHPEYKIIYAAHPSVRPGIYNKIIDRLQFISEDIVAINAMDSAAFNEYFAKAKYLITDYSSVAYDFAYKKDSVVIYYLNEKMIGNHYDLRDVFYEGHCGVLTKEIPEILSVLEGGYDSKKLEERKKNFFTYRDGKNVARVMKEIESNS